MSVSYTVLVNNSKVGLITPGLSLRQGCLLSSYLFILCVEGMSALIRKEMETGLLHGVRIYKGAPIISHLLFADDNFFFFRANVDEARTMLEIFYTYATALG